MDWDLADLISSADKNEIYRMPVSGVERNGLLTRLKQEYSGGNSACSDFGIGCNLVSISIAHNARIIRHQYIYKESIGFYNVYQFPHSSNELARCDSIPESIS